MQFWSLLESFSFSVFLSQDSSKESSKLSSFTKLEMQREIMDLEFDSVIFWLDSFQQSFSVRKLKYSFEARTLKIWQRRVRRNRRVKKSKTLWEMDTWGKVVSVLTSRCAVVVSFHHIDSLLKWCTYLIHYTLRTSIKLLSNNLQLKRLQFKKLLKLPRIKVCKRQEDQRLIN